ncbi:MAG: hypothetical protein WBH35_04625 [Bacillota bacterium]|jgi:uncharacterized membrane protein YheB (UPF0754 family)|nr:hypothetical protein [Bacillota bacterium]HOB90683.1 hypothetical protein [Bacillota bacterium]HPZ53472.1 hypothetical protein [Bacillota bacterium]HQD18814.1 hypothetical protein [Bacillota bacterium]
MQEQGKDILSSFLTEEQIKAVAQLKDTLKPEEVAELRTAGERLLKNVKTKDDLIELIESAAQSGAPPDIKSPRLRQMIGGIAKEMSSGVKATGQEKGSAKRAALRTGTSQTSKRKRRGSGKKR